VGEMGFFANYPSSCAKLTIFLLRIATSSTTMCCQFCSLAGGPLLYFRVSSPKDGLVAKCWDCNNWGCATSRAFREVAPLRGGRQGFRHRRLVWPVNFELAQRARFAAGATGVGILRVLACRRVIV